MDMNIVSNIKSLNKEISCIIKRNKINGRCLDIPAKKNKVNIFQYHPEKVFSYVQNPYNLGDSLGEIIVEFLLNSKGIDIDADVSITKHFNCVGSNIFSSYQDATIWGSGANPQLPTRSQVICQKISRRKLDIRAVRGPLTRDVLLNMGYNCPEVYGDPAILMPLIYNPVSQKKRKYIVIPQFQQEIDMRKQYPNEYIVSMNTNDYKFVIDQIVSSEIVYTSSLHGIILAEAYGVPAIFFRRLKHISRLEFNINFKFHDWYRSTGRESFPRGETLEEALNLDPPSLPNLDSLVKGLLDTFPYDLWEVEANN